MKKTIYRLGYPALLLFVILLSFLLFLTLGIWDNKYAGSFTHPAVNGVMRLDMDAYLEKPLTHLVSGWEFYQYKFLTPEELSGHVPDTTMFIGQYGGFEAGDKAASPHGVATYRLTIFTDSTPRDYALELPEIYSAYQIWVNGILKKTEGFAAEGDYLPQTSHSMLTFTAAEQIEIVVAVQDDSHFYSGMVYPPAFGSVEAVLHILSLRLLLRAAICGIALVIALLSLFFGRQGSGGGFPVLALLCLCFLAYAGHPLVHMLGLGGDFWYDIEIMGFYALLFSVIWLSGRLCRTPAPLYRTAMTLAAAVCLSVPLCRRLLAGGTAAALYRYSALLSGWKWMCATYLLLTAGYAVLRKQHRARALLAGVCIIATALVADRLMPWYEPVVTGWFGEVAAFALILITLGILCADALNTYRENRALEARAALDAIRLDSYHRQESLQQRYIEQTRKLAHDTKGSLLTLRHYLRSGQLDMLDTQLDSLLGEIGAAAPEWITPHRLLGTVLANFLDRAQTLDIRVEHQIQVPAELAIDDMDLVRLTTNLLDNALEACQRMDAGANRWIHLRILFASGILEIICENSFDGAVQSQGERFLSQKADPSSHGYGTRIIQEIAHRLGSLATFRWDSETFRVEIRLNLGIDP